MSDNPQRIEWRIRTLTWLLAHLDQDEEGKEQFIAMWEAALDEAFCEGTDEAADLILGIREAHDTRSLQVAEVAIRKLAQRNRRLLRVQTSTALDVTREAP